MCGLQTLSREEKLLRANEILNSTELKQAICHEILGCTFKDIERAMSSVIRERQITEEEQEMLELEELAPDKFDPEITFKVNKQASNHSSSEQRYHPLTREETAWLMAASNSPYEQEESEFPPTQYPTLSREECERLVREHYEYKEREKIKRDKLWASSKTTELEVKTKNTKKHTKSTKA